MLGMLSKLCGVGDRQGLPLCPPQPLQEPFDLCRQEADEIVKCCNGCARAELTLNDTKGGTL